MSFTELSQVHNVHISNDYNLNKRRRRRRTSITAGEESEANVTCGFTAIEQNVLEEGEHKEHLNSLLVFALFEDDFTIIHGTAGFAAFGSSTSGYGYSPPSATLA